MALPPKPGSWASCQGGQPCAGEGECLYHIQHPAGAVPIRGRQRYRAMRDETRRWFPDPLPSTQSPSVGLWCFRWEQDKRWFLLYLAPLITNLTFSTDRWSEKIILFNVCVSIFCYLILKMHSPPQFSFSKNSMRRCDGDIACKELLLQSQGWLCLEWKALPWCSHYSEICGKTSVMCVLAFWGCGNKVPPTGTLSPGAGC